MELKLPKLGEGADSGSVASLLVAVGDTVKKGQTVLEVENEKAVAPIPSPASGTVSSIAVKEGDAVSAGQTLMVISAGEAGGDSAAPEAAPKADSEAAGSGEPAAAPAPASASGAAPVAAPAAGAPPAVALEVDNSRPEPPAPPAIRRTARQLGINLRLIQPSGRGGRVEMVDLQNYIARLQQMAASRSAAGPKGGGGAPAVSVDFSKWGPVRKERMSSLRQTISRRMLESWTNIPHVTQFDDADVTGLMELRKKHAAAYEAKGAKLTLTSFALKAVVVALKQHPMLNSSLDEAAQELVVKEYHHIGLAVDTEHGLMVPVIRDVDKKSLLELSLEVNELAEKARQRKIGLEEMQGGTFTISNQGGIGGGHFTPIVNRPEVAILGLGRGGLRPVVREGVVEVRSSLPLAISYDHRVIDGGMAARFTVDLVKALEGFDDKDVSI